MTRYTALVLVVLSGCTSTRPEPPFVTPDPEDGASPEALLAASKVCAAACANMRRFGCPEARKADSGDTCTGVCEHARAGRLTDLRPLCIARAPDVDGVRACGTVSCVTGK